MAEDAAAPLSNSWTVDTELLVVLQALAAVHARETAARALRVLKQELQLSAAIVQNRHRTFARCTHCSSSLLRVCRRKTHHRAAIYFCSQPGLARGLGSDGNS